jgi:hypothetical protein
MIPLPTNFIRGKSRSGRSDYAKKYTNSFPQNRPSSETATRREHKVKPRCGRTWRHARTVMPFMHQVGIIPIWNRTESDDMQIEATMVLIYRRMQAGDFP